MDPLELKKLSVELSEVSARDTPLDFGVKQSMGITANALGEYADKAGIGYILDNFQLKNLHKNFYWSAPTTHEFFVTSDAWRISGVPAGVAGEELLKYVSTATDYTHRWLREALDQYYEGIRSLTTVRDKKELVIDMEPKSVLQFLSQPGTVLTAGPMAHLWRKKLRTLKQKMMELAKDIGDFAESLPMNGFGG